MKKLKLTKKGRIVLFAILGIVVLGSGGFLLWRVLQEESIAPEDSEARPPGNVGPKAELPCDGILIDLGHAKHLRNPSYKVGQWVCGKNCMSTKKEGKYSDAEVCPPTRSFSINDKLPEDFTEGLYRIEGLVGRGHYQQQGQSNEKFKLSINGSANDQAVIATTGNVNKVLHSGSVGDYWEGSNFLGTFHLLEESNSNVTMSHTYTCSGSKTAESVHLYKFCLTRVNICQGGEWVNKPTGTYDYGTKLNPITVKNTDSDGLGDVTITLNNEDVVKCDNIDGATCYTTKGDNIELLIGPGQQYIGAGDYDLTIAWKDGKGIGGSRCSLSTSFTISEEAAEAACSARAKQYAYDDTEWTPDGIGFCKTGSSATPSYQELVENFPEPGETVTWVCKNSEGSVDCEASRADINEPSCGTLAASYSSQTTAWPSGSFCSVGSPDPSSPTFPSVGGTTNWNCYTGTGDSLKEVICTAIRNEAQPVVQEEEPVVQEEEPVSQGGTVPQTGIFDTVLGKISLGFSFIFLGGLVSQYSRINYLFNSIVEKYEFKKEIREKRRNKQRTSKRRNKLENRFKD